MAEMPEIGKISPQVFCELIYPRLGARDSRVLVGPRSGVDTAIVEIASQAVSFTTDPVFIVPEYGWERAAWFALHILVSDSVTSGLKPAFLTIDLNLPMSMTADQLSVVWETIHRECQRLGIAIITGHTARYENCHYPMVGGATVIGTGRLDEYVGPAFVRAGDAIIITKGPAIEASGTLATMFPKLLARQFGTDFSQRAQGLFYKMSAVEDALTAVAIGVRDNGVSAMHDATECGIWGGVVELAEAASLGVRLDKERIVVEEGVPEICGYFGIDPYAAISEGTLIISCRPQRAAEVVAALAAKDIRASVCGELLPKAAGLTLVEGGQERPLKHPIVDPFWQAFYNALERYNELEG